jgi:hypothetical protein
MSSLFKDKNIHRTIGADTIVTASNASAGTHAQALFPRSHVHCAHRRKHDPMLLTPRDLPLDWLLNGRSKHLDHDFIEIQNDLGDYETPSKLNEMQLHL